MLIKLSKLSKNFSWKRDFNLFIIGAGSGGLACAQEASKYKEVKIGIANFVQPTTHNTKWGIGGTCVNVGCIPKKLFHHASNVNEMIKE